MRFALCLLFYSHDDEKQNQILCHTNEHILTSIIHLCFAEQTSPKKGGPTLMADCLLNNLRKNKSDILGGCGNFDVYSEINGPRKEKYHFEERRRKGYLLDDGSVDFDGPGKRIFFPQHFRIQVRRLN